MGGRRDTPPVARPTGKRRLIELGKDLIIAALTCSALLLAWQTPLVTHLRGWVAPPPQVTPAAVQESGEAVTPYAMAVRTSRGLYGIGYDAAAVSRAFEQFSPYLEQALSTAGEAVSLTQTQWQAMVEAPGVCFLFQGTPSLTALSAFLGGEAALQGSCRTAVLCRIAGQIWLGWQDGEGFFGTVVTLEDGESWDAALEDYGPNGAAYAYDLAREDDAYDALDGWTLVTLAPSQPTVYATATADFITDAAALGDLLTALGFLSGADAAYETAGGLAVTENGDRLQVSRGGEIIFRAGDEARYPIGGQARALPGEREAVLCAWEVLDRCAKAWKEEGDFVLTGVNAVDGGWEVLFQTRLDGVPVVTGENGWCARFLAARGKVTEFMIYPRVYTDSGETGLVATPRLAAAALRSLPESSGKLLLRYTDNYSATLAAGWVSEE